MENRKIIITTDSAAYIPPAIIDRYNIHVVPIWVIWGQEHFRDGVDIQPSEFYRRLKESDKLPTTSQPSVGEFIAHFQELAANAAGIISMHVTSKLSGTYSSAVSAVQRISDIPIQIIDTMSVSMGQGFAIMAACQAAERGEGFERVVEAANSMVKKVQLIFLLDTLEFLHKGGRISGAKALMATALKIKPLLHFVDGMIEPLAQVRTWKKGLNTMLDQAEERLAGLKMAAAAVVDSDAKEVGDAIAERVKKRFGLTNVLRAPISPAIGVHAGPGAVGLAFYSED